MAQIPQGQVLGTVTDSSGAVVPGATVTLRDEQKGTEQSTVTSDDGLYAFSYLNSGMYTVTVEMVGFKKAVYSGNQVQIGEKKRVDVALEVGEVTNTVEVNGAAALVSTDSAAVGTIVGQKEVVGMPLNGREFSLLAGLMPGVRVTGRYGGALITDFAAELTVGGTSGSKNSYSVDGVDNSFNIWNGPAMNPSIDAIQEFRIDKSQFAAEYGRGGAQIQLVTKSGTNEFHGAAWEYARNYALNAGNYNTHEQDTLKRHQFGANLGGPIIKNKAFFFFNYEAQRERSSVQPLGSVFTEKMRTGDLSELLPDKVAIDPVTNQPFSGNIIPANRLDPVAVAYMNSMMGHPTSPGVYNNFIRPFTTSRDWSQYIGRVDYRLTEKDNLFGRFNIQPRQGEAAPLSATSVNHREDMNFYNAGIGWDRSWSNTLVTESRFGYHRENLLLESNVPDVLPAQTIKGFGTVQPPSDRLPVVFMNDYHYAMWGFPLGFVQNSYEFVQNVSVFKGNHLIKTGFGARNQEMFKNQGPAFQMSFTFNGYATGVDAADYLLGLPYSASENLQHIVKAQKYGDYDAYVQDDWKVHPRLTLNLGLRYELNTLPSEVNNLWSNFSPELRKIVLAGDHVVESAVPTQFILDTYSSFLTTADKTNLPRRTLGFGDHNNLSPRIGFAWRPFNDNKTVVRGGYGIFYLLEDGNTAFNNTSAIIYGGSVSTDIVTSPNLLFSDPFSGSLGQLPPPSAQYRDPYMRTPYLQQFTLGIQRQLPWEMVAEVNLQDQNSLKLETSYSLNQSPIGPGSVGERRPYPEFAGISTTFHDGRSRYDAMDLVLRKSSTHYTFQWSHTWAKNMIQSGPYIYAKDLWDGPGGYVPHLDKAHFLIDLPFGKGMPWLNQGGVVDAFLGGWTLSGVAILHQSGSPLSVSYFGDPANVGIFSVRAKRVGSGKLDNPTPQKWFDTAAFTEPDAGTFGDAGTGIIFGPPSRYFDAAIYKSFVIKEGTRLQFRTEMFNAFNHPNLQDPGTSLNSPGFGQIFTKNLDPRTIQMALRLEF